MKLITKVHVARRFQRSIRIDSDLHDPKALEGFICPESSAEVLLNMSNHVKDAGQAAFTWTGPYGSGKSSLVVALSALLNGNEKLRSEAQRTLGKKLSSAIWRALPTMSRGWKILPVTGRRASAAEVIGEALQTHGYVEKNKVRRWTDDRVLEALEELAASQPRTHGGLVVFLDEMGKFLEDAAINGSDIYLFQRLAEAAGRSKGRLIVIGILHQAFDEYANRLTREARDEWAKIQGRFVDLAVNVGSDEQVDLISRAIQADRKANTPSKISKYIAEGLQLIRPISAETFALTLEHCWPLHPVVACLLGPISRRRFGQNQRSLFGFLNSAEPYGFQDFLRNAEESETFTPDRLWDYLKINFELAILASPDGHKWSISLETIERCEALGGSKSHLKLLKTIAILDLFRERSGIRATPKLLHFFKEPDLSVDLILKDLEKWSLVVFRKHLDAYAIYAGSDFDIEQAQLEALESIKQISFKDLKKLAGLQPVLAKRHYHETGAMRWVDVDLVPLADLENFSSGELSGNGCVGKFLLAVPTNNEEPERAKKICRDASNRQTGNVVIGLSTASWQVIRHAKEFLAISKINEEDPKLSGDSVARREVLARIADVRSQLEFDLHKMFSTAEWFRAGKDPSKYSYLELNHLASNLADERFPFAPKIQNELLNREDPSANAISAQKIFLRKMVLNDGQFRLGIEGYPAEGGLFDSILEKTGLYQKGTDGLWDFVVPGGKRDLLGLSPAWRAATDFLETNREKTVGLDKIYEIWKSEPFGIKEGLLPVFAVAFILSQRNKLGIYREGLFQPKFNDVDIDILTNDPTRIQVRWMILTDSARKILLGMERVVRNISGAAATGSSSQPIDIARGLVGIYDELQPWTKRTMRLSENALRIRGLFKQASDPNKFLFNDIPALFRASVDIGSKSGKGDSLKIDEVIQGIHDGIHELSNAYPSMLEGLQQLMLVELQASNSSDTALASLRERAKNIFQLSGDFRLNAFVGRLGNFKGTIEDIEGIASLASNKPPRDWVDADLDQTALELAILAQGFVRAEAFARVKGRPDKRQAIAIVVGRQGNYAPIAGDFSISDGEQGRVKSLIESVRNVFTGVNLASEKNIILAALAELSAQYLSLSALAGPKAKGGLK